ncbi:MAG: transposase [Chloroflexi bacterium]|nr:transposase [Chloroflexota bacterium]
MDTHFGNPAGDPRPFVWVRLPPSRTGFRGILPRRWAIDRTFAWLPDNRRLSNDYERLCQTSEVLIYVAITRLRIRRLAHS